jgi:hypothetical protein
VPGSRGTKSSSSMTSWTVGVGLGSLGAVGDVVVVSVPSGARAHPASAIEKANDQLESVAILHPASPSVRSCQPSI